MNKASCSTCGVSILATTAMRNDGRCAPCRNGTRESIEEGRRWNLKLRELQKNPGPSCLHWASLVDRVHKTEGGFEALPDVEKRYFAVCCLESEVYNGGLGQFFSNSSGSYYEHALAGLADMGAAESIQLLRKAKQILFDFSDVPIDTGERRAFLRKHSSHSRNSRVDQLDELFRKDPDSLLERIERYANSHELWRL
jgi:hypothetical protein